MKILYVVHGNPWVEFSGTPLIAGQYALAALKSGCDVGVMTPDLSYNRMPPPASSDYTNLRMFHWPALSNWSVQAFQKSPEAFYTESALLWPYPDFVPDIVHIIDWVGISPSFLHSLKILNVPIMRHVWNFEDICQFIEPIHKNSTGTPCTPPLSAVSCGECIANKTSISVQGGQIALGLLKHQVEQTVALMTQQAQTKTQARRAVLRNHIENYYDHLFFAAKSFCDYWQSFIKNTSPYSIVPHGCSVNTKDLAHVAHEGLNCVYIGGANYRKGWDVIEDVFGRIFQAGKSEIRLRVYGNKEQTHKSSLARFAQVEFFDAYSPDQTAEVFSWADLGIVPTRFETYCRVIREMMFCGVVPLASSAFGIPDVVINEVNGLLIDPENPLSLVEALARIEKDPEFLARLKTNAETTHIDTPDAEFRSIDALYRKYINSK